MIRIAIYLFLTPFVFFSGPANAILKCGSGISIDVRNSPYNMLPSVANQNVGAFDEDVLRATVMTAAAGQYRQLHSGGLSAGTPFKIGSLAFSVVDTKPVLRHPVV